MIRQIISNRCRFSIWVPLILRVSLFFSFLPPCPSPILVMLCMFFNFFTAGMHFSMLVSAFNAFEWVRNTTAIGFKSTRDGCFRVSCRQNSWELFQSKVVQLFSAVGAKNNPANSQKHKRLLKWCMVFVGWVHTRTAQKCCSGSPLCHCIPLVQEGLFWGFQQTGTTTETAAIF